MEAATQTELNSRLKTACDIATGRAQGDPAAPGKKIIGGEKDLNCKGKGPYWFRMVYRDGAWRYVSQDRLPAGNFRAAERRATVHGQVYPGEIVINHDRGGPVETAFLVAEINPETGGCLTEIAFFKRRDGKLTFALPDGSEVVLPDPRAK